MLPVPQQTVCFHEQSGNPDTFKWTVPDQHAGKQQICDPTDPTLPLTDS